MNIAIILAAGTSSRYNKKEPKQFDNSFNKKMLIEHSIETFIKHSKIDKIILVVPELYLKKIKNKIKNCIIIKGGKTRQESSFLGLMACPQNTTNVLIHDGARPFVSSKIIENCINNLNDRNIAVCPALPCTDTIAEVENNEDINKILNRNLLYKLQTPQAFNYKILLDCHKKINEQVTDDISIIKKQGYECKIIKGDVKNMKITYKEDFKILESLI